MKSQNNNPFATSQQSVESPTALSLAKLQLGYFGSAAVCFASACFAGGFQFASVVLLAVFFGPLLSLVETAHGIFRAVFLFTWWGTPWPFTISVACLGFLSWNSIFFGCRAVRRPERRMSLFISHLFFVGYWSGTMYLVHRVVEHFVNGFAS